MNMLADLINYNSNNIFNDMLKTIVNNYQQRLQLIVTNNQ